MDLNQLVKNLHNGDSAAGLKQDRNILWFDELSLEDISLVGEKNATLGELTSKLSKLGVKTPSGFAITSHAYAYFLEQTGLKDTISDLLIDLDVTSMHNVEQRAKKIRAIIQDSEFPELLKLQISRAYKTLEDKYGTHVDIAVRSSVVSKNLNNSFIGQHESYLNIHSEEQLIHYVKRCIASLFTLRAITYRAQNNIRHFDVTMSIGIQKMVRSDLAVSGMMSTLDPSTGFNKVTSISAGYGLGEPLVEGVVTPDEYMVFKPTLEEGYKSIISKTLGEKHLKRIYDSNGSKLTKDVMVPKIQQKNFALDDSEILELSKVSIIIEDHISAKLGYYQPVDLEWAKDGQSQELFIVDARAERIHSKKKVDVLKSYELLEESDVILRGEPVGNSIAHGQIKIVHDVQDANHFKEGDILVTDMTDADFEPLMRQASAIIVNRGSRNSHSSILARELEIPVITQTYNATEILENGAKVTVSCAEGTGIVMEGFVKYKVAEISNDNFIETKTKSLMSIENTNTAMRDSFIINSGVGSFSQSSIIKDTIKIHPNALLFYSELQQNSHAKEEVKLIDKLTHGYEDKIDYYIDTLAQEISKVAAAFYPKKVMVNLSDLNSKDYLSLIGGQFFEPLEENTLLGFQGVSRYISKEFLDAFKLECLAIRKVREELGFKNIKVVLPMCKTLDDLKSVDSILSGIGLKRGVDGLEIMMSCSTPANVILADQFLMHCDGFVIDIDTLSQLTLGYDSTVEIDSFVYSNSDLAVKELLLPVIHKCNERGKYVSVRGELNTEMISFVVESGIQNISLLPSCLAKNTLLIAELEHTLSKKTTTFKPGFSIKNYTSTEITKKVIKKNSNSTKKKTIVKKVIKKSIKKVESSKTIKKSTSSKKKSTKKPEVKKKSKKSIKSLKKTSSSKKKISKKTTSKKK